MLTTNKKLFERTIALAGVFQAASLIEQLTSSGTLPEEPFEASITSLYEQNPASVLDVYGGEAGIKYGLEQLSLTFSSQSKKNYQQISRYVVSIFHLSSKLLKSPELLKKLDQRIKLAKNQAEYFNKMHPNVIGSFAQAYLETAGTYKFRVQVVGKRQFMERKDTMDKVRALLLAGVRAAILWRQVGGTNWHLLFSRKSMVKTAQELLKSEIPLS